MFCWASFLWICSPALGKPPAVFTYFWGAFYLYLLINQNFKCKFTVNSFFVLLHNRTRIFLWRIFTFLDAFIAAERRTVFFFIAQFHAPRKDDKNENQTKKRTKKFNLFRSRYLFIIDVHGHLILFFCVKFRTSIYFFFFCWAVSLLPFRFLYYIIFWLIDLKDESILCWINNTQNKKKTNTIFFVVVLVLEYRYRGKPQH